MGASGTRGAAKVGRQTSESQLIHFDTSFLIRALAPKSDEDASLRSWLREQSPLAISSIAWAEFLCGPLDDHGRHLAASLFTEIAPFGASESTIAADLFNSTGRRRGSLMDCMIAAVAISSDAALATSNVADFKRFVNFGLNLH